MIPHKLDQSMYLKKKIGQKDQVSIGSDSEDLGQSIETFSWDSEDQSSFSDEEYSLSCGSQNIGVDWQKVFLLKRTVTILKQNVKELKFMPKQYYYHKCFLALKYAEKKSEKDLRNVQLGLIMIDSLKLNLKEMVKNVMVEQDY